MLSIATKAKLTVKTNARMQADMLDVFLDIMYSRNFTKKFNFENELLFCLKTIYFISVTLKLCNRETLKCYSFSCIR